MTVILPRLAEGTGIVRAAMSTRQGGVSAEPFGMNLSFRVGDNPETVAENRRRFLEHFGAGPGQLAVPVQVHGTTIRRADGGGEYPACDALMTDRVGLVLGVTVADCVPILLADPVSHVIAAAHAGWRGTAAGIARAVVRAMEGESGISPRRLLAFVGPAAGACCYAVGPEVADLFTPEVVNRRDGGLFVDLKSSNAAQLAASGVLPGSIEIHPLCTITERHLLHSFRRDGSRSGRMMAAISLLSPR